MDSALTWDTTDVYYLTVFIIHVLKVVTMLRLLVSYILCHNHCNHSRLEIPIATVCKKAGIQCRSK